MKLYCAVTYQSADKTHSIISMEWRQSLNNPMFCHAGRLASTTTTLVNVNNTEPVLFVRHAIKMNIMYSILANGCGPGHVYIISKK